MERKNAAIFLASIGLIGFLTTCYAQGLDVSGYTVRQFNRSQSYTIPEGTVIQPNGYIVIGRNSTQADFEAFWGVTLATNVLYLNAGNTFPRIDGGEQFALLDGSSTQLDGMTPATLEARNNSIQRLDASTPADNAANWHVVNDNAATPGSGAGGSGASALVISEYSDASFFFNEFIEIFYYDGAAAAVPPVLQALPSFTVTLNETIQFAVEAVPTDGDPVTLSVSNAPAGATFGSTNEHGVFRWDNAAPTGVYTMQFYAVDKDGAAMDEITITVAGAPDVSFSLAESFVNEDAGTQLVAVALSRAANAAVDVTIGSGTASQGVDFVISSTTLVFSASGATEQYVPIIITDDDNMEGLETIILTLDSATGANIITPDEHILSIRDNETITIMAANLVNGYPSVYQDPAWRIFQALKPDIVGLQECIFTNESMRAFVDLFFGEEYDFYIEPQSSAYFPQPNAIISRWPIKDAGEWSDPITANRDFAWATIDIPGDRDLHVVSLHLYYSGTEEERAEEARALTNYIAQAGFSSNDYLVIAGDLNTADRTEPCLAVLTNIVSDFHKPADQFGDTTTSRNREYTFDYVLPSPNLDANHYITSLQGINFDQGLIFDTRLWTNNIPPPALTNDSAVEGNAHMAVMKSFSQGRTPPSLAAIPEQRVVVGHTLQFDVYAKPTDGDSVTLAAQNLPAGATFASTNENGVFAWPAPATAGVYQCSFSATDTDGTESRTITIKVLVDGTIWINELHYDNAGTDINEGIEIAGNAGMDLSFYSLAIYNGADGILSKTIELDGYLPDQSAGFGTLWIPIPGLQNEDEAIALIIDGSNLVQFISYEGIVVAVDGPAIEETSENIGSESGGETDCSLQLTGLGTVYSDFTWQINTASRGSLNALQRMYPSSGDEQQPPAIYPLAPISVVQSNSIEISVIATDVNDDPITLSVSNAPAGSSFNASGATGTFSWASAVPVGVYTTTFQAVDNDGSCTESIVITVASGREAPEIQSIGTPSVTEGRDLAFEIIATDTESDPITLSVSNIPAGAVFSAENGLGLFTWTNATPIGTYTSTAYASDIDGSTSRTFTISVQAATNPPVFQAIGDRHATQHEPLIFTIEAIDPDGESILYSASGLPGDATLSSGGIFSWTNPATIGVYTSTFYATDNDGTDSQTVTITVVRGGDLWINEFHYDNDGIDTNEFVEVAGTAGFDLTYHALFFYRDDGSVYASNALSGTIPDEGCGFGAASFNRTLQQSGGIALVKDWTNLIVLLSYSPTFLATNGPAAGEYSLDIKVREASDTPVGNALQLEGYGSNYIEFSWAEAPGTASPGFLNDNQFIYPCHGDTNLPPELDPIGHRLVVESNTLSFAISATDANGDAITYSVSNAPAGALLTSTNFEWASASPAGVYTCTFYATDGTLTDSETIAITVSALPANDLWINEFHYDNDSTDANEGVEIAGTAGAVLTNFALYAYNGGDGGFYDITQLTGTLPDEGCGFGAAWFDMPGLQNGPDALALVRLSDNLVLQFISYEGSFTATDGPAAGATSDDLAVSEPTSTPLGNSLQLGGQGATYSDFTWLEATNAASPGFLNDHQFIYPCNGDSNLPPVLSTIGDQTVFESNTLSFTVSTSDPNGDTVTCTLSNTPSGASFDGSTFQWLSPAPAGVYTCTFYATDGTLTDSETISITVLTAPSDTLWINEFHYDNDSTDTNEGVEVAGEAATVLSNYVIYAYNGSDGAIYDTLPLSGTLNDEGCGFGAAWFDMPGLQNGPDALALVRLSDDVLIQFISYEGSFTATDGPAAGLDATDVSVNETTSTPIGESLQLTGTGTTAAQFSWSGPASASPGTLNNNQFISGCSGDTDSDNDGMTDQAEFIAGTDPDNPDSLFDINPARQGTAIQFNTITGRLYHVYSTTILPPLSWDIVQTNIVGTGSPITIPIPENDALYIRTGVTLP